MADQVQAPGDLRCTRSDGRRWRCKHPCLPGKLLCNSHYLGLPLIPSGKKSGSTAASPPPSPPANEDDGNEEARASGRDHLDRRKKRKHSWAYDMMDVYCDVTEAYPPPEFGAVGNLNSQKDVSEKKKRRRRKKKTDGTPEEEGEEDKKINQTTEEEVMTRDLPFGRMAISPPLPQDTTKEPTRSSPLKLGLNPSDCRLVNPKFRTKNIDPPPIATVKVVPFAENVKEKAGISATFARRRTCHWCKRNSDVSLIKCLTCKKTSFCSDCIKERCIDPKEIEKRCIICRGTCECNSCKINNSKDASSKENSKIQKTVGERQSFHYLITQVLPVLEQINKEQRTEMEMEAKLEGKSISEVEIGQVENGLKKQISCNKCCSYILDMHRSCPNCMYKLCLSCCQDSRPMIDEDAENISKKASVSGSNAHTKKKKSAKKIDISRQDNSSSGSDIIFCASLELGGCGKSALFLRSVFPLNYTMELETRAREIILRKDSPKLLDATLHCSFCSDLAKDGRNNRKELLEASRRKHPGDNFLYSPSIHDAHEVLLVHFQKHWRNSHPVVVRDLLENTSNMTWDPISLFSNYLKMCISRSENGNEETDDSISLDWYKAEFSTKVSFSGSVLKVVQSNCETLKLEAELSSALSQKVFADHFAILIDALPIQDYTNPGSGILNLAAMPEEVSQVSEFTPHVYIGCGSAEEIRKGGLVAELRYSCHDLVNILVHASKFAWSSDEIDNIKSLMRKKNIKDGGGFVDDRKTNYRQGRIIGTARTTVGTNPPGSETESDSSVLCSGTSGGSPRNSKADKFVVDPAQPSNLRPIGAQWDVFRRQDAPKLFEYIQKHSDEFNNPKGGLSKEFTDPLLDGNYFLDSAHIMKLKDEYKIEPWTFTQKLGEAVLIPAGCPYQMRNLESCMNVVLGFISPEHAGESIKLTNKLKALSVDAKPKATKLEVKKMIINKINGAIEELRCEASN